MAREVELFKSSLKDSQPLFLTSSEPKSNTPPHNLRPLKGRRHFVRAVSNKALLSLFLLFCLFQLFGFSSC